MKIATWNINSIRIRVPNVIKFLQNYQIDILLLQEIKCLDNQFPYFEFENIGYKCEIFGQKALNGVAIIAKIPLEETKKEYFKSNLDESRYIESCFSYDNKYFKIASVYIPNGGPRIADGNFNDITKTNTFYKKMEFCDLLKNKFEKSIKNNEFAFFCGDYNVCPNLYLDVHSPLKDGTITNTEPERQKFKELLNVGMCDLWRDFYTTLQDYTWWGYRPYTMFQNNQGYRIDMILCSQLTKKLVKKCYTLREIREQEKPSDHIPTIFEI
jgi:exodeoxyribonuclease-3